MGAPVAWFETTSREPTRLTTFSRDLGSTPLVPPTNLPDGFGRFEMFSDPDGKTVGLWS